MPLWVAPWNNVALPCVITGSSRLEHASFLHGFDLVTSFVPPVSFLVAGDLVIVHTVALNSGSPIKHSASAFDWSYE